MDNYRGEVASNEVTGPLSNSVVFHAAPASLDSDRAAVELDVPGFRLRIVFARVRERFREH